LDIDVPSSEDLGALDLDLTKLRLPPGMSATSAIKSLREADPEGTYDYAHIYDPSGETAVASAPPEPAPMAHRGAKVGMIDAGIDETHPAFHDADITAKVTTAKKGAARPTDHGTAIASLLVGSDRDFHGALVGATLYAADAFGGSSTGGAADDIARAIAWLVDEDVPVINISITGPKNALLEAAVRAALKRGHVIVAAVGNDGPAVGVKYPAAYDGVIAVTSVDANKRVQIDANRGPSVAFAARGVDVRVAKLAGAYGTATGTSYASPIVAARFAELVAKPDEHAVASARETLIAAARSTRRATRDYVYGYGILGTERNGGEYSAAR
jgi:subtilisin family serine protease